VLWQLFTPYKQPPEMDREAGGGVVGLRRMDHVSLATRDIEWQIAFQERVFGMELLQRWTVDVRAYHGAVMSIPNSLLKFEMVQAFRPDSFVHRFIEQRGRPGLHHICCEVASVDDTYAALQAEGIQPHGGIIAPGKWHRHTFLHPRDSGGVLFQLFEGK
jgi:methylmalonyl-CoA/ethylmalonyl-CoA epimerase